MSNGPHRKRIRHFEGLGHLHELTFSCYRRKPLLTNDPWRRILARSINDACNDEGFGLVAFVFMPEHVHLLVLPLKRETSGVSRFLARVKQPTSKQIKLILVENNSRLVEQLTVQERPGKRCFRFWQEGPGFDRNIFSPQALSASIDYIHLNPVKRHLCARADQWKWSSARFYLNDEIDPDLPQLTRPDPMWFETSGVQVEHR